MKRKKIIYLLMKSTNWITRGGILPGGEKSTSKNYKHLSGNQKNSNKSIPQKVLQVLQKTAKRQYFKRLAKYRQCSQHRRTICVKDEMTTVALSAPYTDTTATDNVVLVTTLCDDPDDLNPKFSKKRLLEQECEDILQVLRDDVIAILKVI